MNENEKNEIKEMIYSLENRQKDFENFDNTTYLIYRDVLNFIKSKECIKKCFNDKPTVSVGDIVKIPKDIEVETLMGTVIIADKGDYGVITSDGKLCILEGISPQYFYEDVEKIFNFNNTEISYKNIISNIINYLETIFYMKFKESINDELYIINMGILLDIIMEGEEKYNNDRI